MECSQAKKPKILIPAEAIANSTDLLFEILLLLPTKSLLRFKCVSKQWLSLICNPQFTHFHTRRHHHHTPNPTPTALLLNNAYTPTPEFQIVPLKHNDDDNTICKVPFLDYLNVPRIKIRQSCNGLLLCSSSFLRTPSERNSKGIKLGFEDWSTSVVTQDDRGIRYFICNPTTKKFKQLCFPSHEFKNSVVSLNLAFDPFKSTSNYYYKVVSIRQVSDRFEIYVYSSETDSWNLSGIPFRAPYGMRLNGAVFCNGKIHWSSKDVYALYFDVDNECVKDMPMVMLPRSRFNRGNDRKIVYFGESRGYLHLIVTEMPNSLKFDVWEMAADYSGWHVRYHVDLGAARGAFPGLYWPPSAYKDTFSVLSVIRAEEEEESVIVVFVDHKAISCNVHDGTSKKLCDLQTKPKECHELDYEGHDAYQYFETLSCV